VRLLQVKEQHMNEETLSAYREEVSRLIRERNDAVTLADEHADTIDAYRDEIADLTRERNAAREALAGHTVDRKREHEKAMDRIGVVERERDRFGADNRELRHLNAGMGSKIADLREVVAEMCLLLVQVGSFDDQIAKWRERAGLGNS
jgi:chromosome segregation ATPase